MVLCSHHQKPIYLRLLTHLPASRNNQKTVEVCLSEVVSFDLRKLGIFLRVFSPISSLLPRYFQESDLTVASARVASPSAVHVLQLSQIAFIPSESLDVTIAVSEQINLDH
jgi:hypothetical protein